MAGQAVKPTSTHNPFLAQLHFSDAISVEGQIHVMVERCQNLHEEVLELERRARNQDTPVPLPEGALQKGSGRAQFSLEYGLRYYYFQIEWTENIIRVLKNAAPG